MSNGNTEKTVFDRLVGDNTNSAAVDIAKSVNQTDEQPVLD